MAPAPGTAPGHFRVNRLTADSLRLPAQQDYIYIGSSGWDRTNDNLINSQGLYR